VIYSFDQFELDTEKFELRRGSDIIAIEPRLFMLLSLLVENNQRVVSKDEIIERIWDGRYVSEAVVSTAIKGIRRALNDDGSRQVHLRTVRGHGFRFVTAVMVRSSAVATAPDLWVERRTAAANPPSLAVLPFVILGTGQLLEAIGDAIPAELISFLSKLRWLKVIARGSSFRFRDREVDHEAVRNALSVRYFLSGSVEATGARLHTSVELVEAASGRVIWSNRYVAAEDTIHLVRPDIVRDVILALELEIPLREAERARSILSEHRDAWALYHLGLERMYRFSKLDNDLATEFFQEAVGLDPEFARAHAGLSFTSFQRAFLHYSNDPGHDAQLARRQAERSLAIDPNDPMGNFTFGRSLWLVGEPDVGLPWLDRAINLNPNFAQGFYARAWADLMANRLEAALHHVGQAISLSPIDPFLYAMLATRAVAHLLGGDYQQGADWAERAARSPGAHYLVEAIAVAAHGLNGDKGRAETWAASVRKRRPGMTGDEFFQAFPFKDAGTRELFRSALGQHRF
jgi:TolB-like protein